MIMDNHIIITGKTGSGKSFMALEIATKHEGTTLILNDCAEKKNYETTFPALKAFEQIRMKKQVCIKTGGKYFISRKPLWEGNQEPMLENAIIFDEEYEVLRNDQNALVAFDDGIWYFVKDKKAALDQLAKTKCKVVIVVQCMSELTGDPGMEIPAEKTEALKENWKIYACEKRTTWVMEEI